MAEQTGPTPQERAERVLREAWQACATSPVAGDPYQWQAAALQRAGLLAESPERLMAEPMPTGEEFIRRYSDPGLMGPAS